VTTRDGIGPDGLTDLERAAGRRPVKRLTDEQMTANLRAAVAGHTPYADRQQAELRQPLTEAELKAGGGWHPAITDVDMTPRPRYRESQQAFEARMARMHVQLETVGREVKQRNRNAALRHVELANGYERWWTVCSCGFCGLRVEDPEVARREYDAHVCAAAGVGQAAVDRAIAETDRTTLVKRERHVLKPSLVEDQAVDAMDRRAVAVAVEDDFEQRVKLLEHK
jgi:hypothetical protein